MKKLVFPILVVVFIIFFIKKYYSSYELSRKGKYTTARIIDFFHTTKTNYVLQYKYYVNGKSYKSEAITGFFKCKNESKGCVGEKFEVYYLPDNPNVSDIDLREYEKYRNKIFIFKKPKK
ncbi:DUF3592 domain-containing protein [Polaribacter sp. WD7]|uniref:DUF3592 domain-containing protein n=1 Tax=Polaribacter sp. WD7 TaxID=2269061 RepID=UPI000DF42DA0|nr:DUF3592 domain-containing protein [Polaribacter sp. WD7]RCS28528.1 DUF3592 domain-containing protein [Polaribacter sp. WD7]